MFKNSFGYLVKEGLHYIRANRQMSVASIGVLIACMVLIGGALLLSFNINSLMGYVESFNEVVVWIDDDLGSAGTERLKAEIDDLPNIASKQYISKEDALKELSEVLSGNGFCPVAAAAMVGEHAFAPALAHGRPDAEDIAAAKAFARNAAHTLRERERPIPAAVPGREPIGPYYTPLGLDGEPARYLKAKPLTDPLKCARCGLCAALCPMGSIPRETPEECGGICIKCQACVKGCPTGAKYFADAAFCSHRAMLGADLRKTAGERILPAPVMNIPSLGKSRYGFCGYKYRPTLCVALTGASLPAAPRFLGRHFSRAKTPKSVCVLVKQR